jgi:hypothetical protein
MKYVVYECGIHGTLSGGLGDRLIGIFSSLAMAIAIDAKFYIKWHDPDISPYFDYEKHDYMKQVGITGSSRQYTNHGIESLCDICSTKNIHDFFDCEILYFNTNQNMVHALCKNPRFATKLGDYESFTKKIYKLLFSEYLKPRPVILEKVNEFVDDTQKTVGIQLRFGDHFMNSDRVQINRPGNDYPLGMNGFAIMPIIQYIIQTYPEHRIFVTSDVDVKKTIDLYIPDNTIVYFNMVPTHIERSVDKSGIIKSFVDFLCLSKCDTLYITLKSNFGRCAALVNKNDHVNAIYLKNNGQISHKKPSILELSCKSHISTD